MSLTKCENTDEHGLSASDIFIDTGNPLPTNVLPRPYSGQPIGNGVNGVDNQLLNAGLAPKTDKKIIYANELPAPPRNQLDIPFPMQGVKRKYPLRKYAPNKCYAGYAKDQGIAAFVCGSGGKNDGHQFRGNRFSRTYNRDAVYQGLDRDMDIVSQGADADAKPQIDRPVIVEGQSLFYPYPSFGNRHYPLYKVYPDTTEYTTDGLPYYNNEFKGLVDSKGVLDMKNTVANVTANTEYGTKEENDMLENMTDKMVDGIVAESSAGGAPVSNSSDGGVSVMVTTLVIVVLALVALKMR